MLRKITRFCLIGIAWIVVAVLAWTYGPLLISSPDQDHCSFGPVTNEQYRAYLTEAQKQQRAVRSTFSKDEKAISQILDGRAREMIGAERSIYKQVAITHAVLRSVGAEFLNVGGVKNFDPYETDKTERNSWIQLSSRHQSLRLVPALSTHFVDSNADV